jgi:anionic cell wall polymer biosynthesis LytR-Cps2A-Psr (LCP) family protein
VPTAVNDTTGHIQLPAGTYTVKGERALDYVRVRHDLGTAQNGDIGRMKRQQTFLASMAHKAVSAGTLANPLRLYKFLDAGTKSLTTDPGLASLKKLVSMGRSFDGIGLKNIQFLTVPFEAYPPDANRLQWAPSASRLWMLMREDKPVGNRFSTAVTTAETTNGKPASPSPNPSPSASASPSASPSRAAAAERAAENGLCA